MKEIDIYHEAPLCIFDKVREVTDGDYALVHLLDGDEKYAAKFIETAATRGNRELILDNSAYELGESFDEDKFAEWIYILKPDIYVVPDVPGDAEATVSEFHIWKVKRKELPGKRMGVLQGKSTYEIVNCFNFLRSAGADIIGVPFLIGLGLGCTREPVDLMSCRVMLMKILEKEVQAHPIHMLGVALPQEGVFYRKHPWVVSVDTSNPVLHGMLGNRYEVGGMRDKPKELLADHIHDDLTEEQQRRIKGNIDRFRDLWLRGGV